MCISNVLAVLLCAVLLLVHATTDETSGTTDSLGQSSSTNTTKATIVPGFVHSVNVPLNRVLTGKEIRQMMQIYGLSLGMVGYIDPLSQQLTVVTKPQSQEPPSNGGVDVTPVKLRMTTFIKLPYYSSYDNGGSNSTYTNTTTTTTVTNTTTTNSTSTNSTTIDNGSNSASERALSVPAYPVTMDTLQTHITNKMPMLLLQMNSYIQTQVSTESSSSELSGMITSLSLANSTVPWTCYNRFQDDNEVDTDCGGVCKQCIASQFCKNNSDCLSGSCVTMICEDSKGSGEWRQVNYALTMMFGTFAVAAAYWMTL